MTDLERLGILSVIAEAQTELRGKIEYERSKWYHTAPQNDGQRAAAMEGRAQIRGWEDGIAALGAVAGRVQR